MMSKTNNEGRSFKVGSMSLKENKHGHISSTDSLSDTVEVVREVARKMGKTTVKWDNAKNVMVITKPGDVSLINMTREIVLWFMKPSNTNKDINVYVDGKLKKSKGFQYEKILKHYPVADERLGFWTPELCASDPKMFDFIITLGGDGTVLFASWLFQTYVPPVIPFHLGSLGFLTPFDYENFDLYLTHVIEKGMRVNLRSRLTCTIYRRVNNEHRTAVKLRNVLRNPVTGKIKIGGWCSSKTDQQYLKKFGEVDGEDYVNTDILTLDSPEKECMNGILPEDDYAEHRQIPCFTTIPVEKYQVLNDLVVDRGPSPYMSLLELFGDDKHLTTVQADGLAISTPTGSTAYSLSANGSLTHPEIRATLITPICPHTLSFRPTLVPDSMELRICVPFNSRNTAWASFDGRGRVELKQGDHIKVTASKYAFPSVCKETQTRDWFNSLSKCLHWNKRERQKSFAIVEHNQQKGNTPSTRSQPGIGSLSRKHSSSVTPNIHTNNTSRSSSPPNKKVFTESYISSSSDGGSDEVFAMLIDEDYPNILDEDEPKAKLFDDYDEYENNIPEDDFIGWTDDEINRARFSGRISRELDKLSMKH
ncbi:ATP-NAD kinase-like domain-containing protein [Pilobolus umbonatus]|nr:ATP-NAD kinase-like domain-containing protein [Pilobolus umbonatus]